MTVRSSLGGALLGAFVLVASAIRVLAAPTPIIDVIDFTAGFLPGTSWSADANGTSGIPLHGQLRVPEAMPMTIVKDASVAFSSSSGGDTAPGATLTLDGASALGAKVEVADFDGVPPVSNSVRFVFADVQEPSWHGFETLSLTFHGGYDRRADAPFPWFEENPRERLVTGFADLTPGVVFATELRATLADGSEVVGNLASWQVSTVPVPPALVLLASGLAGLGLARRRRRVATAG